MMNDKPNTFANKSTATVYYTEDEGSSVNDNVGLIDSDESISVSQLNRLAKTLLENNMPVVWIKGEISGLRTYSHIYFDLKDEGAKVSCVLFANVLKLLDFKLENGQQIEVRGKVTIYPQNGSYQINIERIRQVGMGELWEAYHRLVNKLKSEGLFALEHKKAIPIFPRAIGVVTSKEGAVIRDVITTLKRRMPNIPIIVYHSAVQGVDAGMQITKAIRLANQRNEVDVLIICRGGGSMQDLWCFNEEVVAREVFASSIPIISAVGHETDTTIIDFVADLRAPTPTGAAELVAKSRDEWAHLVHRLHDKLTNNFIYILDNKTRCLELHIKSLKYLNPVNQLKEKSDLIKTLNYRLKNELEQLLYKRNSRLQYLSSKLSSKKINLEQHGLVVIHLSSRLNHGINKVLVNKRQQVVSLLRHLHLVNPTNVLSRGYAIVKNRKHEVVYASHDVKDHERIEITLYKDSISAIADLKHNTQQEELI
jgi:exodeoxyribonuclease VII large subunit